MTKKQAVLIMGGVIGVTLLLPVIWLEMSGIGAEARAYSERAAKARAFGFDPDMSARLAANATRPEGARRAFDELQAFLKIPGRFDIEEPNPGRTPPTSPPAGVAGGPPPAVIARSQADGRKTPTEAELRASLDRMSALARAAEGGSHYNWREGYGLLFPQYAQIRGSFKAVDALSRRDAAKGDFTRATSDLIQATDVWRAYGDDPIAIEEYVRSNSFKLLFRAAGGLLARPTYPATEARRLREVAEGRLFGPRVSVRQLLVAETSTMCMTLEDPKTIADAGERLGIPSGNHEFTAGIKVPQIRRAWQSDALKLMNATIPKLPDDPYDFVSLDRVLRAHETAANAPRGIVGRAGEMFGINYEGLATSQIRREAMRRVLIVAAGLRAGESEAGLRARLGRFAMDPYDGKPIRVRPAASIPFWLADVPGLATEMLRAVYSIGPDRSDDWGRTDKKPERGDLVLVVPK